MALVQHPIFLVFSGLAILVGIVALLWGNQSKLMGASVLLASILVSNILHALFDIEVLSSAAITRVYVLVDLVLAGVFITILQQSNAVDRHRWAAFLVATQLGMVAANVAAISSRDFAQSSASVVTLNLLMIAALLACLISFTPKSWDEAIGMVRLKWMYLKSDLFHRVIRFIRSSRRTEMVGSKKSSSRNSVNAHVGLKIREARILRNMSREELATALGVSIAQVQKYESGNNRVSATALFVLSQFFGTDVQFFFEGLETGPVLQSKYGIEH